MPELPEVETTLRGIEPYVKGSVISEVLVRNPSLRWPVPEGQLKALQGEVVTHLERRAKYILLHTLKGTILLHLGMSGSLRVLPADHPASKHDHIDITFDNSNLIRLNDPRRFGCCLLLQQPVFEHSLLVSLGPEPLTNEFDGERLFTMSRKRTVTVKSFIMDAKTVVGVGNIYASESLFLAKIRPTIAVKRLSRQRCDLLAQVIKQVLARAIKAGGTTLNDFTQVDGKPGYFAQSLAVYGRQGEACDACGDIIKSKVIGQRNTFYCPSCQTF